MFFFRFVHKFFKLLMIDLFAGEKLEKWIGVSEMLVSVFSCGIIFALISGQPLLILGSTGPLLVFEEGL